MGDEVLVAWETRKYGGNLDAAKVMCDCCRKKDSTGRWHPIDAIEYIQEKADAAKL
jgi:hypothetical protein